MDNKNIDKGDKTSSCDYGKVSDNSRLEKLLSELEHELALSHSREKTLIAVAKQHINAGHREPVIQQQQVDEPGTSRPRGLYEVVDQCGFSDNETPEPSPADFKPIKTEPVFNPTFHHATMSPSCYSEQMGRPLSYHQYPMAPQSVYPVMNVPQLPHIQLPKFSGNIIEYPSFKQNFKVFVELHCHDNHKRLMYLQMYLTGEALSVIQGCNSYMDKVQGYRKAWQMLEQRYGNDMVLMKLVKEDILSGPSIRIWESDKLNQLVIKMNNCKCLFESKGVIASLNASEILQKILNRLPFKLKERFAEVSFSKQKYGYPATFEDLLEIIDEAACYAQSEWAQQAFRTGINKEGCTGVRNVKGRPSIKTFNLSSNSKVGQSISDINHTCVLCKGKHALWNCNSFIEMEVLKRRDLIKGHDLCFNCLKGGHRVSNCNFKRSCQVCRRKHNTMLHIDSSSQDKTPLPKDKDSPSDAGPLVAFANQRDKNELLHARKFMNVLPVRVWKDNPSKAVLTYALLDNGSTTSICSSSLVRKLHFTEIEDQVEICCVGTRANCSTKVGSFYVEGVNESNVIQVEECRVLKELPDVTENIPNADIIRSYSHLKDIELPRLESNRLELLLGADVHEAFRLIEQRCGEYGEPFGLHTALGWSVFGTERETCSASSEICARLTTLPVGSTETSLCEGVLQLLDKDFYDMNDYQRPNMSVADQKALSIMQENYSKRNSHYQLRLLWKSSNPKLPNNREMALKRLNGLKGKFIRNPDIFLTYSNKVSEYIENGHASIVPKNELNSPYPTWYLPHHCTGKKFRIVFDCGAKHDGISINSQLHQGPDLCNNLNGVLLRFRQEPVAVSADIKSMFHQVFVAEPDRDALRFLWWPNNKMDCPPIDYRMNVFPFGLTCSPSCASFALRKTSEDNLTGADEQVVQIVQSNFYVDDLLKSFGTAREAVLAIDQLRPLLESGGFHLTKFASNSPRFLSSVPGSDCVEGVVNLDQQNGSLHQALGVYWNTSTDELRVRTNVSEQPFTRRGLLSTVSQIYDVLGIVQPFILPVRKLLQETCQDGASWDAPLSKQRTDIWRVWLNALKELDNINIPRSFKLLNETASRLELHVFCDASTTGYGAVCYVRCIYESGLTSCIFCMGKSRVAPLKAVTIPRLELTAATIAVKLSAFVCDKLEYEFDKVIFWTDATIVLRYIYNVNTRFKTFVANRLQLIHSMSSPKQWRHVPSTDNPADVASRGLMPDKCCTVDLWLNGPPFLSRSENEWPSQPDAYLPLEEDEELKNTRTCCACTTTSESYLHRLLKRYSTFKAIQRATAWWLRFVDYLRSRHLQNPITQLGPLSVDELQCSTLTILRMVQLEAFPDVMTALPNVSNIEYPKRLFNESELKSIPSLQQLKTLSPIILDGVMRIDGRLQGSELQFESKHQIILPSDHPVTYLIIRMYHEREGHSGPAHILNCLRKRYWVIRGRAVVRKVLNACFKCRFWNAKPLNQRMGNLPEARVVAGNPPFTATGVDLMGPLNVKLGEALLNVMW